MNRSIGVIGWKQLWKCMVHAGIYLCNSHLASTIEPPEVTYLFKCKKTGFFECYDITKSFPYKESYNLVQQIRRSAVSELLNIAEGTTNGEWKSPVPLFSYSLIDLFTY